MMLCANAKRTRKHNPEPVVTARRRVIASFTGPVALVARMARGQCSLQLMTVLLFQVIPFLSFLWCCQGSQRAHNPPKIVLIPPQQLPLVSILSHRLFKDTTATPILHKKGVPARSWLWLCSNAGRASRSA